MWHLALIIPSVDGRTLFLFKVFFVNYDASYIYLFFVVLPDFNICSRPTPKKTNRCGDDGLATHLRPSGWRRKQPKSKKSTPSVVLLSLNRGAVSCTLTCHLHRSPRACADSWVHPSAAPAGATALLGIRGRPTVAKPETDSDCTH